MKRLLTLLFPFFLLASAGAEEWRSYERQCSITLPDTEPWQRGNAYRLPAGEMIFTAAHMETRQVVTVVVIPDFPTGDISNPAASNRFAESLTAQGFTVAKQKRIEWIGRPFIEIVGRRLNDVTGELVSVTRATIDKNKTAYLVSTFGLGNERRMEDERFMRVLNSFRFDEGEKKPAANSSPLMRYYRFSYIACAVAMVMLIIAFAVMYIRTHRRD